MLDGNGSVGAPRAPKGEELLNSLLVEEDEIQLRGHHMAGLVSHEEVLVGRKVAKVLVGKPLQAWSSRDGLVEILHGTVRLEDEHLLKSHPRRVTLKTGAIRIGLAGARWYL